MKTCLDCGKSIENRGATAKRCLECAEKRERGLGRLKTRDRLNTEGETHHTKLKNFKEHAHLLQGDSCIMCSWNVPDMPYGGCVAHHIVPVSQGGSSDAGNNAAVLCPNCHVLVHRGIISTSQLLRKVTSAKKERIKSKISPAFIDKIRKKVRSS